MKRDLYKELINWKESKQRKPLVLRGARQVGKTYLLKEFAKKEYKSFVYLNFEQDPRLNELFAATLAPATILQNLSLYQNQSIHSEDSLIIFDEIQESPAALNSLKYFYEQMPQFHIAAAGSLLGVKLANDRGFPVGKVNFLDLFPLTFFEFLEAIDREDLRKYLEEIQDFNPLPDPIHDELIKLLKHYFIIGGMPEAISEYIKEGNFNVTDKVKNEILEAYLLDFAKHAPKDEIIKITQIWEAIAPQLAKENKKFIFAAIRKSARGREYENAIQWLSEAGLICKSYNISAPKLPLKAYIEQNSFKIFLLDVGLLCSMLNLPTNAIIDRNKLFAEFNGAFTENFVAQELRAKNFPLYYWTSGGSAEVDFILEKEMSIFPLEVKAGTSNKKKSLIVYKNKFNPDFVFRISLMNLKKDGEICNIPLYLISKLNSLIRN